MSPDQLTELLTRLRSAADVVEAIDSPDLGRQRGWDLSGWRYEPVPWGVRFLFQDPGTGGESEVVALALAVKRPGSTGDARLPGRERKVVLFG